MKATSTYFSFRSFAGILMGAGALITLLVIYDYLRHGREYMLQAMVMSVLCVLFLVGIIVLCNSRREHDDLLKSNKSLKKLQTQLLRAEKFSAIGHLAAGIAHEINNPIGFINSNLQTLQQYVVHYTRLLGILNKLEKALKDKDQERAAEVVTSWQKTRSETNFTFMSGDIDNLLKESMEGVSKIGKIVSDLRTLSSPDRGVFDNVNLETLMDSMLNISHNEIKYKAELKKEYGGLPPVFCNPQKIGQVFVNLVINAAQAIKDKGFITIKTYIQDEYACIDVKDTGCGISPDNFENIFYPLFTTKSPGVGVGLGLSLSLDIIRKHGGTIKFVSKLGEGTTFTVMLPLEEYVPDTSEVWRGYERD